MNKRLTHRRIPCAIEKLETRQLLSAALANAGAVSMAFDGNGVLHAAYYDSVQHDLLYASRDVNGTWSSVATIDAGPNVGSQLSLALDHAGQPGVAYYDARKGDLKFAHLVAGAWSVSVLDSKGDVGRNPSQVFDASDHPLISYYDATLRILRLAAYVKNRLRVTTIASGSSAGQFSSIAESPVDGTFAVAFESTTKHQLRLASGNPGHVSQSLITTLGSAHAIRPAATFDASGKPVVGYVDPSSGSLVLALTARRGWSKSSILSGADFREAVQLSFATGADQPQVLFADPSGNVRLASNAGGVWSSTIAGSGSPTDCAIDQSSGAITLLSGGTFTQIDPILTPPGNLTATSISSGEIDLSWTEDSADATGFVLERATAGGAFSVLATLADVLTYADTNVTQGTSYAYRLSAIDSAGSSLASGAATVSTPSDAPTNFVAQISLDWAPWIELTWTDNAVGETGYRIERATDGVHFSTIDILPPDSTDYLDTLDDNEQTYTYRVIPFDGSGDGAASTAQSVLTGVDGPLDLSAVVIDAGRVNLSWTNVSGSADHFEIDCIVNGENATVDTSVSITTNSYSVTSLADGSPLLPNTAYMFYVVAKRGNDVGVSNPAYALTGFGSPPNLEVDSISSSQITLTWGDVLGESGYEIQSAPDNTHFSTLATTGPDVTRYTITGLPENTSYHFRIRALSGGGDSTFLWYAMPKTELNAPTNVVATPLAGGSIELDWTGNSAAATSYQISIAQGNGQFGNAVTLPSDSIHAILTAGPNGSLQPGLTYRIRIVAMTADNQSEPVEIDSIIAM